MNTLVFGIDGGDLEIMKNFDMPFFHNFLNENKSLDLEIDLFSRGWVEILTGKNGKDTRGFYMSPVFDGTHKLSTKFSMSELKNNKGIEPLWSLSEKLNKSYCIMNVPTTTPVPKTTNGIIIGSGGGGINKISGIPENLVSDHSIRQKLTNSSYVVDIRRGSCDIDKTETFFNQLDIMQQKQVDSFLDICTGTEIDFGFIATRSTTEIQYLCRSEIESYISLKKENKINKNQLSLVHKLLEKHFFNLDQLLQKVFTTLEPDNFIITSDHNIVPCTHYGNVDIFLIENKFLKLRKTKFLINIIKKIISTFKLNSAVATANKHIHPKIRDNIKIYDWNNSIAFGNEFVSGIYINDFKRFGGPVKNINYEVNRICDIFNKLPETDRSGAIAVPYRSNFENSPYNDYLPDIEFKNCEHIYFDNKGNTFVRANKNYGMISSNLKDVIHPPTFTGTKGKNPLCVLSNKTEKLVRSDDQKDLTLIYKLIKRSLEVTNI